MSRPRKAYPFDSIRAGRVKRFSVKDYPPEELGQMLSAAYRRRHKDGTPMFKARSGLSPSGYYEWIELYRTPDPRYSLTPSS